MNNQNGLANFIAKFIINGLLLFVTAKIIPGMEIKTFGVLIAAAFVLAVLNAVVKPILIFCTLPINILTLGLFILVINALLMYWTSKIVDGFYIRNFMSAFWGALVFSAFSVFVSANDRRANSNPQAVQKFEDKDGDTFR